MGLNRDTLRAEAEKSLAHACTDEDALSGLTTPCAALVSSAHEEANRMGYSYTGTEHLLLALIREKDGVLRKALETRGLDLEAMRRKIIEFLQGPAASSPLEASTMLALRHFQADLRRAVEDLSKKFDTVVEAVATLKSDLAQLRADVLKGNS
jgi:ATP-dependent Clp protease ATP-binding subunit ClpA